MIRWLRQLWCAHRGHPYSSTIIPIVGRFPHEPEKDTTFCNNCGAELGTAWTDNAGTEYRRAVSSQKDPQ